MTSSSSSTDYSDLMQTAKSGTKLRSLVKDLLRYFVVENITEGQGYSNVACSYDESTALEEIRKEFKKEFVGSKKLFNIVKAILPHPKKKYYISFGVRLVVFQSGPSNLEELVINKDDDCIVLIPVVIIGSAIGTIEEEATQRKTTFTCEVGSEFVMSGRCSIEMEPKSMAVCVVLTMGKDKE